MNLFGVVIARFFAEACLTCLVNRRQTMKLSAKFSKDETSMPECRELSAFENENLALIKQVTEL